MTEMTRHFWMPQKKIIEGAIEQGRTKLDGGELREVNTYLVV